MKIRIFEDQQAMAREAAGCAIDVIRRALNERNQARILAETGEPQMGLLRELTTYRDVDWANVELFCGGEYIGLPADHPASLRRFLQDRLVSKVGIRKFVYFGSDSNMARQIADIGARLEATAPDIAFLGIGENGRLALNNPPADFESEEPFLPVDLNFPYRAQQVAEGWFGEVGQVPMQAITVSIRQLLKAKEILVMVPGGQRALAVKVCAEHGVSPTAPATILRTHPNATLYLDQDSASQLSP